MKKPLQATRIRKRFSSVPTSWRVRFRKATVRSTMPELFSESIVHLILYFAILAILTGVGIYVASRFRANSIQQEQSDQNGGEQLNYFRDLKLRGKLTEEEFRIIKKQLSAQIVETEKRNRHKTIDSSLFKSVELDSDAILARARALAALQNNQITQDDQDTQIVGTEIDNSSDETVVG